MLSLNIIFIFIDLLLFFVVIVIVFIMLIKILKVDITKLIHCFSKIQKRAAFFFEALVKRVLDQLLFKFLRRKFYVKLLLKHS